MTLARSDINASAEELNEFHRALEPLSVGALWVNNAPGTRTADQPIEPKPQAVPHVWRWRDLRPQALRAGELVGTHQAERRVLQLKNPAFDDRVVTTNTLFAGIQVVMPGEIARAHRHTMAALRFIIESKGGYTTVDGEPIPMLPGDLVLTPNWAWHDHANDSATPMMWLDGLDVPLVRMLDAVFQEYFPFERQDPSTAKGLSHLKYGSGGLRVAGDAPAARHSPLMHYRWSETRAALDQLAQVDPGTPHDGLILEYTNPVTGGPVMPTIACFAQRLQPGERTRAHRHTSSTIYHVVEGSGCSIVGGQNLEWQSKDTFCVPNWTGHQHVNLSETEPAYLFSFSDLPVLRSLDLWREENVPGEWG